METTNFKIKEKDRTLTHEELETLIKRADYELSHKKPFNEWEISLNVFDFAFIEAAYCAIADNDRDSNGLGFGIFGKEDTELAYRVKRTMQWVLHDIINGYEYGDKYLKALDLDDEKKWHTACMKILARCNSKNDERNKRVCYREFLKAYTKLTDLMECEKEYYG